MSNRTGLVWHERYMWHDSGRGAGPLPPGGWIEPDTPAENAATKRRFKNLLDVSGLVDELVPVRPRAATTEELRSVHTAEYVERVAALSAGVGGEVGPAAPVGRGSYEIAALSAGGVIAAVDAVLAGDVRNCYALVRPPGHHALADSGMGFCLFANIAIAVHHARRTHGLERVAVVDWDVHHGNGTQAAFYDDPSVLTMSIHQDRMFPRDSGFVDEIGEGPGRGFNVNVPLPPGSGVGAYMHAFEEVVVPWLDVFRPEIVFVASGFDANVNDPLGRQLMHSDGFRRLTELLLEATRRLCDGRLVLAHEGGYSTAVVPFCGLAVVEALSGVRSGVDDPFLANHAGIAGQELQPHQADAIGRAPRPA